MIVILMGVTGCGKTEVGSRLARQLGWSFHEGDQFHPPANIQKMSSGTPLDDSDRIPWLDALRDGIQQHLDDGVDAVLACSALKKSYRKRLSRDDPRVRFVHLNGDAALIERRLRERRGHFMDPDLLQSQIEDLEDPEDAIEVDIDADPEAIVTEIRKKLGT